MIRIDDTSHLPDVYARQVERAARRAQRFAGAAPPFELAGIGMTAVVLCDARGHAFKVTREPSHPHIRRLIAREAAWLARANQVPEIRDHVARFYALHPGSILERECIRAERRGGQRRSAHALFELHETIRNAMAQYGYGAPEFKEDSYVYARGRGWVLVDAGFAQERGAQLVLRAVAMLKGRRFFDERPASVAFDLRMEAGRTVPENIAARLSNRLLAMPGATEDPKRSAPRRDPARRQRNERA